MVQDNDNDEERSRRPASSTTSMWRVLGRRVPKKEIVFSCQMLVILIVVCVSVYNLTTQHPDSNLWTALLSSCLGYVLPHPTLKHD